MGSDHFRHHHIECFDRVCLYRRYVAADERAKRLRIAGCRVRTGIREWGPPLVDCSGQYNLRAPFWAAAALSLANFLYGLFVLPESLPVEKRAKSAWHMANPLGSLSLLRSNARTQLVVTGITPLIIWRTSHCRGFCALQRVSVWLERNVASVWHWQRLEFVRPRFPEAGRPVCEDDLASDQSLSSGLVLWSSGICRDGVCAAKAWAMFAAVPSYCVVGGGRPCHAIADVAAMWTRVRRGSCKERLIPCAH